MSGSGRGKAYSRVTDYFLDELPYALGVLGLTTEQFIKMTLREYVAKKETYEKNQIYQIWLMGAMIGRAFCASEEHPYPTLEELLNPQPELTNKELFELAQSKGILIPEGVL